MNALAYDLTGPPDAPFIMFGSSLGTTRAMWQPETQSFASVARLAPAASGQQPAEGAALG